MGKNQVRRPTSDSNRRRMRDKPSTQKDQTADSSFQDFRYYDRRLIAVFVVLFVVPPSISLLIYRFKFSPQSGPILLPYVRQRGLVKADVNCEEILTEHSNVSENTSRRHFMNPVLAYITPWNSGGYDMAKRFTSKFTHISPVWYDLKSHGTKLVLEGRHNADIGWISELRMRGDVQPFGRLEFLKPNRTETGWIMDPLQGFRTHKDPTCISAHVLPRLVLEALPQHVLREKKQRDKAVDLILKECKDMGYDGIVLESWSRWAAHGVLHDATMRKVALRFVKQLGEALHAVKSDRNSNMHLQLVYVIGPPHTEKLQEHDFGPHDLQTLSESVDGFSLMTYDFSSAYNPGPNAPLKWIRSTLHLLLSAAGRNMAHTIFVGINFYGYDFLLAEGGGAQAITGRDYLSLLEQHNPPMRWDKRNAEHYFSYTDSQRRQHAVFYPTLMSISERLEEARSWGAGISIWEIGQGLDYFFDLL